MRIALDTVYATVGKKPTLFRLLVEAVISGHNEAVPAEERDDVRAIRAEPDAARKLQIYAAAARSIQPRLAPFFQVLHAAASQDADLKALGEEIHNVGTGTCVCWHRIWPRPDGCAQVSPCRRRQPSSGA